MAITAADIRIVKFVPEIDRDSGAWKSIYIDGIELTTHADGTPGSGEEFGFQVTFDDFHAAIVAANPALADVDMVTPIMEAGYALAVEHVNAGGG